MADPASEKTHLSHPPHSNFCIPEKEAAAMGSRIPDHDPVDPSDDTPEFPLSAPIKPDDPERRSEQSRAETEGCVEEQPDEARPPRP
jgi:hypothetical protein